MKYFFILGTNPSLSVAEILARFSIKDNYKLLSKSVLEVDFLQKIDFQKEINFLGGVIKVVECVFSGVGLSEKEILLKVIKNLPDEFDGKFKFGFSFYSDLRINLKRLAMEVKKELKTRKISCRWVTSKSINLSSVVVEQNKLVTKGREVVIIKDKKKNKVNIGKTIAVQNFKSLSYRDYNRPARDSQSGMIPPKLAQIMLNLATRGKVNLTFLDPFCGSGTILMEAALMGIKNIKGSDVSTKAVADSQENIKWLQKKFSRQVSNSSLVKIEKCDVRYLSNKISKNSIDVIVTEPYLGPQRERIDFEKTKQELECLYSKAIKEFRKVLKSNGTIVMVWPFFKYLKNANLNPDFNGFKIIKMLPFDLNLKITKRDTIIYGRENQKIWREIVILRPSSR